MPTFPLSLVSEHSLLPLPNCPLTSLEPLDVSLNSPSCIARSNTAFSTSFHDHANLSPTSNFYSNTTGLHWYPVIRSNAPIYFVPPNDCQTYPNSDQSGGHKFAFVSSPLADKPVGCSNSFSLASQAVSESNDFGVRVAPPSSHCQFIISDPYYSPSTITSLSDEPGSINYFAPHVHREFHSSGTSLSGSCLPLANQPEAAPYHLYSRGPPYLESSGVTLSSDRISFPLFSHVYRLTLGVHSHCEKERFPPTILSPAVPSSLSCSRICATVDHHPMEVSSGTCPKSTPSIEFLSSDLGNCRIGNHSFVNDHSQPEFAGVETSDTPGFAQQLSHNVSASELSPFLQSSLSDIPLAHLEELLARCSIDDVYLGPVRGKDGNILSLDPGVRALNECLSLPYSSTSLAYSPPGIMVVTEMWSFFANERLSLCNHRIQGMNMEALRTCLYEHGLNQLGSVIVLRRRLQEFVRRVRTAQSNSEFRFTRPLQPSDSPGSSSVLCTNFGPSIDGPTESPTDAAAVSFSGQSRKMVKLPRPVILAPDAFYAYLLIIDLEATCDLQERHQSSPEYPHEIIEFPVLLYKTRTRRCVGVFHAYCKPKLHPDLSTFCTNLTQISQHQVNNACPFPQVLAKIENWLFKKHRLSHLRCAIVCDCSADMSKFMRIQCHLDQIPLPSWVKVWINLSKAFRVFYKIPSRHRVTLNTMLRDLNLMFLGQQHRGLDDAINILRVVRTLLADGCQLRVNERVDFGHPPNYVTSVPRLVAESTSGLMGSHLFLFSRKSRPSGKPNSHDSKDDRDLNPVLDLAEGDAQSLLRLAGIQRGRVRRDS